jgi:hypothetical protein
VIASDPVADAVDAAELLDVDMDQLARPLALVADHRRLRLERRAVRTRDGTPGGALDHGTFVGGARTLLRSGFRVGAPRDLFEPRDPFESIERPFYGSNS